jgi:hypothetical protein
MASVVSQCDPQFALTHICECSVAILAGETLREDTVIQQIEFWSAERIDFDDIAEFSMNDLDFDQ